MLPPVVANHIEEWLSGATGKPVTIKSSASLGGGCINNALKIQTTAGVFFIKYNLAATYPEMFRKEAMGLKILAGAGQIRVPDVIAAETADKYDYLLLEYVESGTKTYNFWEQFGHSLAALHKHTQADFGLDHDNYIGSLPQRNRKHAAWTEFFILERLEPMVIMARNSGEMNQQTVNQFESLYHRLEKLIPAEPPALLHGDLWSGNYMVDDRGNPCIIDPAVYYGHREVDLAMTRLFGGFPEAFYSGYNSAFRLENGWEQRPDIHNLYPLMVHVNLFGGGYISDVKRILNRLT